MKQNHLVTVAGCLIEIRYRLHIHVTAAEALKNQADIPERNRRETLKTALMLTYPDVMIEAERRAAERTERAMLTALFDVLPEGDPARSFIKTAEWAAEDNAAKQPPPPAIDRSVLRKNLDTLRDWEAAAPAIAKTRAEILAHHLAHMDQLRPILRDLLTVERAGIVNLRVSGSQDDTHLARAAKSAAERARHMNAVPKGSAKALVRRLLRAHSQALDIVDLDAKAAEQARHDAWRIVHTLENNPETKDVVNNICSEIVTDLRKNKISTTTGPLPAI